MRPFAPRSPTVRYLERRLGYWHARPHIVRTSRLRAHFPIAHPSALSIAPLPAHVKPVAACILQCDMPCARVLSSRPRKKARQEPTETETPPRQFATERGRPARPSKLPRPNTILRARGHSSTRSNGKLPTVEAAALLHSEAIEKAAVMRAV